jgi:HEAT repeat protein
MIILMSITSCAKITVPTEYTYPGGVIEINMSDPFRKITHTWLKMNDMRRPLDLVLRHQVFVYVPLEMKILKEKYPYVHVDIEYVYTTGTSSSGYSTSSGRTITFHETGRSSDSGSKQTSKRVKLLSKAEYYEHPEVKKEIKLLEASKDIKAKIKLLNLRDNEEDIKQMCRYFTKKATYNNLNKKTMKIVLSILLRNTGVITRMGDEHDQLVEKLKGIVTKDVSQWKDEKINKYRDTIETAKELYEVLTKTGEYAKETESDSKYDSEQIQKLINLLEEKQTKDIAAKAAEKLGKIGDPRAIRPMLKQLSEIAKWRKRTNDFRSIKPIGKRVIVSSRAFNLERSILKALTLLPPDPVTIQPAFKMLGGKINSFTDINSALIMLSKLPQTAPDLIAFMGKNKKRVIKQGLQHYLEALASMKTELALPLYIESLKNKGKWGSDKRKQNDILRAALKGVSALEAKEAIPYIYPLLQEEECPSLVFRTLEKLEWEPIPELAYKYNYKIENYQFFVKEGEKAIPFIIEKMQTDNEKVHAMQYVLLAIGKPVEKPLQAAMEKDAPILFEGQATWVLEKLRKK